MTGIVSRRQRTTISESRHLTRVIDGGAGGMRLARLAVPRESVCHERLCAPLRKLTSDISQHEQDLVTARSYSVRSSSS